MLILGAVGLMGAGRNPVPIPTENRMKRMKVLISLAVLSSVLLAGCNTIKGAGKDVQKVGEVVEDAAT